MRHDERSVWLLRLGQEIGSPSLCFDDDGMCSLTLNGALLIVLYAPPAQSHALVFGSVPAPRLSPSVMRQMLAENRNAMRQLAPVLSLADGGDAIEVHVRLEPSELDSGIHGLALVVGALEYWRAKLEAQPYDLAPGAPR